jgi:hypothetical protein
MQQLPLTRLASAVLAARRALKCAGAASATIGALRRHLDRVKRIEDIGVGDLVLSWDPERNAQVAQRVRQLFHRSNQPVLDVSFAGDGEAPERIRCTLDHPFWVEGHGWTPAQRLAPGDTCRPAGDTGPLIVQNIVSTGGCTDVFNFEVDRVHNYFVGRTGVLVHNHSTSPGTGQSHLQVRGERTAQQAVEMGLLRPGKLQGVVEAVEATYRQAPARDAVEAWEVVDRATREVGLAVGTEREDLSDGSIRLIQRGGVNTMIHPDGQIRITRGDDLLLHLESFVPPKSRVLGDPDGPSFTERYVEWMMAGKPVLPRPEALPLPVPKVPEPPSAMQAELARYLALEPRT